MMKKFLIGYLYVCALGIFLAGDDGTKGIVLSVVVAVLVIKWVIVMQPKWKEEAEINKIEETKRQQIRQAREDQKRLEESLAEKMLQSIKKWRKVNYVITLAR
jgi:predicted RND superfamily exporter protein